MNWTTGVIALLAAVLMVVWALSSNPDDCGRNISKDVCFLTLNP